MESALELATLIAMGATLLASVVRGFTGFGAAMVQLPIFTLLYPAPEAVALMAALGTAAAVQMLPGTVRDVDWRQLAPLLLAAVLTIPLGGLVLTAIDPDWMRRGISGMILILVLALISGLLLPVQPGVWSSVGVGAVSGFINGATGVGGPPVVLYLLASRNAAATNRAILISFYTVINAGTCVSLYWHGAFTAPVPWRFLALLPLQVACLGLGSWLFRRATDRIYRRIALGILFAVALFGLLYTR